MAEGKVLKSNGLLCGVPYSISPSAQQVRIEVVTPGHRQNRSPALVRLRNDPPVLTQNSKSPASVAFLQPQGIVTLAIAERKNPGP